jgi:transcription initiation factor TFIIIB Brf1 subunit/transcription initiation factor TFIIB
MNKKIEDVELRELARRIGHPEYYDRSFALFVKHRIPHRDPILQKIACLFFIMKRDPSCPPISEDVFLTQCGFPLNKDYRKHYRYISFQEKAHSQKCTVRPTIFARALLVQLGVNDEQTKNEVYDLCTKVIKAGLHIGKHPMVMAAAIVYYILSKTYMQKDIAQLAKISEPSLRKTYHLIAYCEENNWRKSEGGYKHSFDRSRDRERDLRKGGGLF